MVEPFKAPSGFEPLQGAIRRKRLPKQGKGAIVSANPISDQPGCVCHYCRYERPKLEKKLAELQERADELVTDLYSWKRAYSELKRQEVA